MNSNLPQIRRDGIFTKIKNWFKNLFRKEKVIIEEPIHTTIQEIDKQVEEIKKNSFKENLQIESKDKILMLQRKLKEKQIEIADLTDEELDEMIELYRKQILEKKKQLEQYRNKINSKK